LFGLLETAEVAIEMFSKRVAAFAFPVFVTKRHRCTPSAVIPNTTFGDTERMVSNRTQGFETLETGDANMRHVFQPELLDAMKDCLRDLENVKTVSPDDPQLVKLKQNLRKKITELENDEPTDYQMAAD